MCDNAQKTDVMCSILTYQNNKSLLIDTLINFDNIYFHSFNDGFSLICNLNNYKHKFHQAEWIDSQIF